MPEKFGYSDIEINQWSMKMTIQHQQDVSFKVLHGIKMLIDNEAIIAGGAPRNWDQGKEANDIDLYMRSLQTSNTSRFRFQIENALEQELEWVQDVDMNKYQFGIDIKILKIVGFKLDGVLFQLIVCSPAQEWGNFKTKIVYHMDIGINRIYADWYSKIDKGCLIRTRAYHKDVDNKTLTLYKDCMTDEQLRHCMKVHLPKMQSYYPEYKLEIG